MQVVTNDERMLKRRIATVGECTLDLSNELPVMFESFQDAVALFTKEIVQTPVSARVISLEAALLNSKMIQCIQQNFPNNWKFGKYKRFMLRVQGYTVLFKKLNGKNKPMNIKTLHSSSILNQEQFSLFDNGHMSVDPILIFGYRKDHFGNIYDPKLVYIDESEVKWTITNTTVSTNDGRINFTRPVVEKVKPVLKEGLKIKRASNDNE
jgi:hypothetical protein